MVNESHAGRWRVLRLVDILARMRHDYRVKLLTGIEGVSGSAGNCVARGLRKPSRKIMA
jgi:hypothetical protein